MHTNTNHTTTRRAVNRFRSDRGSVENGLAAAGWVVVVGLLLWLGPGFVSDFGTGWDNANTAQAADTTTDHTAAPNHGPAGS